MKVAAVAGGAMAAGGAGELAAATYDLVLNYHSTQLTRGTFEVPDARVGPANANGFIRFSEFTRFDITINESRFDLPGDIIYRPDDGLVLDASGQPLLFRNIGWSDAYITDDDRKAPVGAYNYLGFIDGSYPTWLMHDYFPGVGQGQWGGTYSIKKRMPAIYSAGKDITGSTQKVVVGQKISVTAIITAGVISSQEWLISAGTQDKALAAVYTPDWVLQGRPIADFTMTSSSGQITPISAPSFKNSSTQFYWTTPGSYKLTYRFTRSDLTRDAVSVMFNVVGPNGTIYTDSGWPAVIIDNSDGKYAYPKYPYKPGGIYLGCGNPAETAISLDNKECVLFKRTVKNATGYTGTLAWVQTIQIYKIAYIAQGGRPKECGQASGSTLDGQVPYDPEQRTRDSPAVPLDARDISTKVNFTARMYLMWKSSLVESIVIPLGYTEWKWYGKADRKDTKSKWKVSVKDGPTWAFVKYPNHPIWSKLWNDTKCR